MNEYLPSSPFVAGCLALLLLATLAVGYAVTRIRHRVVARICGWVLLVAACIATERITSGESPGLRMLAIVAALLWALKSVVSVEERFVGRPVLRPFAWLLFAVGWFGMRPAEFAKVPGQALQGARELASRGIVRLLLGLVFVGAARLVWQAPGNLPAGPHTAIVAALLLPGLSLILHFGIFNVLAGMWRWLGADCRALFRAPLRSTSLGEFWSRRWNLAFSEMAAISVFRPLRSVIGTRGATVAVFAFSGLLHELAISLPVRAGFGLPMLYFTLHAVAVSFEKSLAKIGWAVDRLPWVGRCWTAAWILLPLPLLFHQPFINGCLRPILGR